MDQWLQQQQPLSQSQPITPKRQNQIQGPRPTPLRVTKDSIKIKKPPKHPQRHFPVVAPQTVAPPTEINQPVIIYSVSPKPYLVEPSDFRSLVQHLTGRDMPSPAGEVPASPAARFAALERTSPKDRDRWWGGGVGDDVSMTEGVDLISEMSGILSPAASFAAMERMSPKEQDRWWGGGSGGDDFSMTEDIDVISQMPGILSPAPGNLPAVSTGIFSPATGVVGDGGGFFGMNELMSPFMSNLGFLQSPSNLLFANNFNVPVVSPSPTEFFNIFDF